MAQKVEKKEISPWRKYINIAIDIIAIISSLLNIGFTVLMIIFGLGNKILNIIMLSFLGIQFLFPLIKLIFGFTNFSSKKFTKSFKLIKKWFSRLFKLALAIYLIYSIVIINQSDATANSTIAIFGAVITIVVFILSAIIDLLLLLIKLLVKNKFIDIKDNILQNRNELFSILIAKTDDIKPNELPAPETYDDTKEIAATQDTKKKKNFFGAFKKKNREKKKKLEQEEPKPKKELTLDDIKENIVVKKDKILDIVFKKKEKQTEVQPAETKEIKNL